MAPTKSPYFYTENLFIQVQDILFSVPKHVLALPGTSFESTLLLPTQKQDSESEPPSVVDHPKAITNVEGKSDDNPIRLPGSITALQFTHFLSFVYTHSGHVGPQPSTLDEWMGVYDVAAMWSFDSVQGVASAAIKKDVITKNGLECIQLGQKYNVGQWIQHGIHLLIKQQSPIDRKVMEDGGLSLKTICAIYAARDKAVVSVIVQVANQVTNHFDHYGGYGGATSTPTTYLNRNESGMKGCAEEIFASEYSAYGGMGKEALTL